MMFFTRLVKAFIREVIKISARGLPSGNRLLRYSMYKHLSDVLSKVDTSALGNRVLSISHSQGLVNLLNIEDPDITEANYPEYDILELPFPDESFDFIVSDQVLEHVEGLPKDAVEETRRLLKPGGIIVHTTVFLHPIHGSPKDFWRYTPPGLRILCSEFSEIIDCSSWGNKFVWFLVWLGLKHHPIPHAKWHPLNKIATINSTTWPVVVWVVAKK